MMAQPVTKYHVPVRERELSVRLLACEYHSMVTEMINQLAGWLFESATIIKLEKNDVMLDEGFGY